MITKFLYVRADNAVTVHAVDDEMWILLQALYGSAKSYRWNIF